MNMPPASEPIPAPPRRFSPLFWLSISLALGWALWQIPAEIARWHYAAAVEAWRTEQFETAQERLRSAQSWNPSERAYPALRAIFDADRGRTAEAAEAIAAARKQSPHDPLLLLINTQLLLDAERYGEASELLQSLPPALRRRVPAGLQWMVLQHAGDVAEAVKTQREAFRESETSGTPPPEEALNALAYALAVANVDLPEALERIDKALDLRGRRRDTKPAAEPADKHDPLPDAGQDYALIDTRGYILYRLGRLEDALAEMNVAVSGMEATTPPAAQEKIRSRDARRNVAVIYYHRALVLEALDQTERAEADLQRVRKLIGKEPDEHLF
jgi:tetratricopeptide (TPR) repeat protein